MNRVLIFVLIFVALLDVLLTIIALQPRLTTFSNIFNDRSCLVLDRTWCNKIVRIKDKQAREVEIATADLPKGISVYAPADGRVTLMPSAIDTGSPEKYPVHYFVAKDGRNYLFLFDPLNPSTKTREVHKGDSIGQTSGKTYQYLQGASFGVTITHNRAFDKKTFNVLFGSFLTL